MSDTNVEEFLQHFGVKGMKWGVRKEADRVTKSRSSDGIPTNDHEKSPHRIRLEAKYLKQGYNKTEAATRANNRIKTEKILAIVGGTAVAAVAIYAGKTAIEKQFTGVDLKIGSKLTNINALGDDQNLDRRMYVTINKQDSLKYKGLLAKSLRANVSGTKIYDATLSATESIKAPSQHQAAKLYKEFSQNNKLKVPYRKFNQQLVLYTEENDSFYKFMKSKGYNAILDANDQFISGYNTKKPLVVFNAASSTVKAGQKIVDEKLTNRLAGLQTTLLLTRQMAPAISLGTAYVGGKAALDTKKKYGAVNKYFKDHPNSELSYAEVYSNLRLKTTGYKYEEK